MRNRDTLRRPGRPGRVHDVDEIVGAADGFGGLGLQKIELGPVAIEAHELVVELRQPVEQGLLRHECAGARLHQLMPQPCGGMLVVERQIGTPRLQNPEQADDHVDRAIHAEPNHVACADPCPLKCVSQLIRSGVESRVAERVAPVGDGDRLGLLGGALGEELVNANVRELRSGVVELRQQQATVIVAEQFEVAQAGSRILESAVQQPHELIGKHLRVLGLHRRLVEDQRQTEVVLRRLLVRERQRRRCSGVDDPGQREVNSVPGGLEAGPDEESGAGGDAHRRQDVLIGRRRGQFAVELIDELGEGEVARHQRPDGQRARDQAHCALQIRMARRCVESRDDQVVLLGEPGEEGVPRRLNQNRRRRAIAGGEVGDRRVAVRIDRKRQFVERGVVCSALASGTRGSRCVRGPLPEQLRRFCMTVGGRQLLVLPLGEIRVLERFADDVAPDEEGDQIAEEHLHREGVGTERGQGEHEGLGPVAGVGEQRLNERAVLEVERPAKLLVQHSREQQPPLGLAATPGSERLPPRCERVVDHLRRHANARLTNEGRP